MEEHVRKELLQICNDIINDEEQLAIEDQLTSVQMLYEKLLVLNYLSSRKPASAPPKSTQPESKAMESQTLPDVRESEPEKPLMEERPEAQAEPIAREPQSAQEPPKRETPPPAQPQHQPRETYTTPQFVRADAPQKREATINESPVEVRELADDKTPEEENMRFQPQREQGAKTSSLNDRYGTGTIKLGLNDRIAFMNHLFDGSQEDLNRVLSQINTFESLAEAENFIEQMIKPEYDWSQKEEFEMRFMDRVRQRFGE